MTPLSTSGPLLFARYAYPPNALGYCGGDDHRALLEYGAAGVSDAGLRELARAFEGAWPYLQLIAASNRIADPLDARVVEAYWVGNRLLERVHPWAFAGLVVDRFGRRLSHDRDRLVGPILAGALPHHSFHVFAVYPWIGLLRAGHTREPLQVMESCRIRWGTVEQVIGSSAIVRSQPLVWDGRSLSLGAPLASIVTTAVGGLGFVEHLAPGDLVSLHWDRVCDRLTASDVARLRRHTLRSLAAVNASAPHAIAAAFA